MAFPSQKELKRIRKELEWVEPGFNKPKNPTKAQALKYSLCERFVDYLLSNNTNQAGLARQLGIDPARVNEIIRYKIDLFTIDKLFELAQRLEPNIELKLVV